MLELILAATGTAIATGLGAIPVFFLGERAKRLRPLLLGIAAGVMAVAAIAGLLAPALDEGSTVEVAGGLAVGVAFLLAARRWISRHNEDAATPLVGSRRTSLLVFVVLLVHSLPEGFAIGSAYASDTAGLSAFIVVAIAIQNIPEGTSIAIPMAAAGFGRMRQFWAAVATSAPQPLGAVIAYVLVEQAASLLPVSFGFAAGAMLALVLVELAPDAWRADRRAAAAGALAGTAAMIALSAALDVSV
jgi:ZIP family zinc transporter